jgi:hypothetical protein
MNDITALKPLENKPKVLNTGFKAANYERFMFDNFKIIDKHKQAVPFKANDAQQSLNRYMEQFYNILVLKARKMGFSSDALGIAATKFIMGNNEKCISMSFDQTAADKQLARAKYYISAYEQQNQIKIPLKYNSKNQMVWEGKKQNDQGSWDYFQNVLQVGSARNTAFGRGDDISFLHLTEVSLADLYELMAGVGEACLPTAHKLLETTAAGFNTYKRYWDESMRNETGFACLFYSPLWEYDQDYIDAKYATLGRLGAQEFPMTSQDAFLTSGDTYFDTLAMRDYMLRVKELQPV